MGDGFPANITWWVSFALETGSPANQQLRRFRTAILCQGPQSLLMVCMLRRHSVVYANEGQAVQGSTSVSSGSSRYRSRNPGIARESRTGVTAKTLIFVRNFRQQRNLRKLTRLHRRSKNDACSGRMAVSDTNLPQSATDGDAIAIEHARVRVCGRAGTPRA